MTVDVLAPAPAAGVLTDDALAFLGALHERFEPRRRELLDARAAAPRADRRRRDARLPGRAPSEIREGDWQVAPAPARPAGPARRDHRPGRPQDGHQRAELGRARASWPTSRTRCRRRGANVVAGPGQPDRRDRGHDRVHRRRRARVQARRRGRDAARAPARLAPGREARARRRRAGRGRLRRRRALPACATPGACSTRARARSSTCPRWSRTSRRGCGPRSSRSSRASSGSTRGRSRPRCSSRRCPPRSRWRRSSTSCASTRARSTPGAGTTSSRRSRRSASGPSSCCPTATT